MRPPANAEQALVERVLAVFDLRDPRAGEHVRRMAALAGLLAERSGVAAAEARRIRMAASLHDIGKLAIPSGILRKPGALTPGERKRVEAHAETGHRMLSSSRTPIFELASTIALTHHERWDGEGYPFRLRGYEIPLAGRIAAVADVFDALLSERPYRPACDIAGAVAILSEGRGSQFDPSVLEVLLDDLGAALAIRSGSTCEKRPGGQVDKYAHDLSLLDPDLLSDTRVSDGRRVSSGLAA